MPVRGSGIGASMRTAGGGSVFGGGGNVFGGPSTGRPASPATATMYPGQTPARAGSGPTFWLLVLVALEALAMLALRHGFRHHHGG
jgi:hypothetical protein